ncbi:hypothetical protein GS429_08820 [Natronorubrum sp. JWXQ-INN-674]|uniref:Uncharacterized protein n=1 Tax=Natronorubrum halalkaliphilum TaxID=2691917 RepID=A0A6B0VK06_9EURY|nr:hypothetical protein [Natronorubrum halalkaliphilum]MXV62161.1 hypothetical protein [Natronorubrum halalkaliphilum]
MVEILALLIWIEMPLQIVDGGLSVLLLSILALAAYAIIGGLVANDARSRQMNGSAVWGLAVFLALLFGTIYSYGFARFLPGVLVVGLYVLVRN